MIFRIGVSANGRTDYFRSFFSYTTLNGHYLIAFDDMFVVLYLCGC